LGCHNNIARQFVSCQGLGSQYSWVWACCQSGWVQLLGLLSGLTITGCLAVWVGLGHWAGSAGWAVCPLSGCPGWLGSTGLGWVACLAWAGLPGCQSGLGWAVCLHHCLGCCLAGFTNWLSGLGYCLGHWVIGLLSGFTINCLGCHILGSTGFTAVKASVWVVWLAGQGCHSRLFIAGLQLTIRPQLNNNWVWARCQAGSVRAGFKVWVTGFNLLSVFWAGSSPSAAQLGQLGCLPVRLGSASLPVCPSRSSLSPGLPGSVSCLGCLGFVRVAVCSLGHNAGLGPLGLGSSGLSVCLSAVWVQLAAVRLPGLAVWVWVTGLTVIGLTCLGCLGPLGLGCFSLAQQCLSVCLANWVWAACLSGLGWAGLLVSLLACLTVCPLSVSVWVVWVCWPGLHYCHPFNKAHTTGHWPVWVRLSWVSLGWACSVIVRHCPSACPAAVNCHNQRLLTSVPLIGFRFQYCLFNNLLGSSGWVWVWAVWARQLSTRQLQLPVCCLATGLPGLAVNLPVLSSSTSLAVIGWAVRGQSAFAVWVWSLSVWAVWLGSGWARLSLSGLSAGLSGLGQSVRCPLGLPVQLLLSANLGSSAPLSVWLLGWLGLGLGWAGFLGQSGSLSGFWVGSGSVCCLPVWAVFWAQLGLSVWAWVGSSVVWVHWVRLLGLGQGLSTLATAGFNQSGVQLSVCPLTGSAWAHCLLSGLGLGSQLFAVWAVCLPGLSVWVAQPPAVWLSGY